MFRSASVRHTVFAVAGFALPATITATSPALPVVTPAVSTSATQASVDGSASRENSIPSADSPAIEESANASDDPAEEAAVQPRPTIRSPFALARAVNEARRRAKRDESDFDFGAIWSNLGIPPVSFDRQFTEAKASKVDLDGDPDLEVIVRLTNSFSQVCRYLVFKRRAAGGWLFVGRVDHDFNKYEMSSYRVLRPGGTPFLVIRGQTGSGTGFWSYAETWYRIDAREVRSVLRYTAEGHEAPWPCGVGRDLHTKAVADEPAGAPSVRLRLRLEFTTLDYMRDEYIPLVTFRRTVRLVWNEASGSFEFDASGSDILAEEFATAFDFVDGGLEDSREFCLRELDRGAVPDARAKRERLERFERDCDQECDEASRRFRG